MAKPSRYFRAGVGAVIVDDRGRVLMLERAGKRGAWQFPQGGLKKGETALEALLREIREEVGIPRTVLKLVGPYPELLAYELPPGAQSKKTGMGQVQRWFVFTLKKPVTLDMSDQKDSEFRAAAWVPFNRAVSRAVSFKKPVYRQLHAHFKKVIRVPR